MDLDFPLIYCNGDSYSDENYHPLMKAKTFGYEVSERLNGFVVSKSISGSCNRRIIRTSLHDLIQQRNMNPQQKIIALINLTFEIRDEIWIDDINGDYPPEESHFRTHQFSQDLNWREKLLNSKMPINILPRLQINKEDFSYEFLKKWSEGRAYFYNSYAERCNLLMDLVLFSSFLNSLSINYLIFQGPRAEPLESEHLVDFFKNHIPTQRILDLEKFGFCDWCDQQGFQPLDNNELRSIGHYGPDAHKEFAECFLIPKLKDTGQI
jgi:hypothetical protein